MTPKKIAEEYVGNPICSVLDNARYQKRKDVLALARQKGINKVFPPPYSPNLTLTLEVSEIH
jgi:transposase